MIHGLIFTTIPLHNIKIIIFLSSCVSAEEQLWVKGTEAEIFQGTRKQDRHMREKYGVRSLTALVTESPVSPPFTVLFVHGHQTCEQAFYLMLTKLKPLHVIKEYILRGSECKVSLTFLPLGQLSCKSATMNMGPTPAGHSWKVLVVQKLGPTDSLLCNSLQINNNLAKCLFMDVFIYSMLLQI